MRLRIKTAVILAAAFVAVVSFADDAKSTFERAESYYEEGDYVQAEGLYARVIEMDPGGRWAEVSALRVGMCRFALGEYADAAAALNKFEEGFPKSKNADGAVFLAAKAYYRMGDYTGAVERLLRVLSYGQDGRYYKRARKGIGNLYDENVSPGEMRTVLADYTRSPEAADLLYNLAEHEYKREDYERSVVLLDEIVTNYKDSKFYKKAAELFEKVREKLGRRMDVVGVIVPMTGEYGAYGPYIKAGIELALADFEKLHPDKTYELFERDSASDLETARSAARDLVYAERCAAIIGPCLSVEVDPVLEVTNPAMVPIISPTASDSEITKKGDYVYQTGLTYQIEATAMAEFAFDVLKFKRFATLYPEDEYGAEHAKAFREAVEKLGGAYSGEVAYPLKGKGEINYSPYTRQVKWLKPQGLYIPGYYTEIVRLLPQLTFSDVAAVYLGGSGWNENRVIRMGGKYIEGAYFAAAFYPDSTDPKVSSFVAAYRRNYGETPKAYAAEAYDAASILFDVLANGPKDADELIERLDGIEDYPGVTGRITFKNSDGLPEKDIVILTVNEGEIVEAGWIE
jgi:branched-chain amino acid transport system substrate-binding protein